MDHQTDEAAGRKALKALVFDSGLGGLSVLGEIRRLRPDVEIVYVADDAAFPYGRLSESVLIARVKTVMAQAIPEHRPDIVVVACSTASTLALPGLRAEYPDLPFVGVVPAIKPAAAASRSGLISVLATPRHGRARLYSRASCAITPPIARVTLVGSSRLAPNRGRRHARRAGRRGSCRRRNRAVLCGERRSPDG